MKPRALPKTPKSHYYLVDAYYRKVTPKYSVETSERYMGGGQSQLEFLGLNAPQVNELFKAKLALHDLPEPEQIEVWNFIWHESLCFEVMLSALSYFLQAKRMKNAIEYWPLLHGWAERVDNWPHSDCLSKFYSQCLETHPQLVLPQLKKWNVSSNPWLQRQSIVSLLYYASARKKVLPFKTLIALVKRHLKSEHMYMQKGVGWTLREIGNVYPKETWFFF